jgi:hypothetical protein
MRTKLVALLSLSGMLAVSFPIYAHHGNTAYDESKEVVLKDATVKNFLWANPHTIVQFEVKDEKGNPVLWAGELGSPSALINLGWTKTSLHNGDVITIYIHQAKTHNPVGRISHVALPDGTQLRDSSGGGDAGGAGAGRGGRSGNY